MMHRTLGVFAFHQHPSSLLPLTRTSYLLHPSSPLFRRYLPSSSVSSSPFRVFLSSSSSFTPPEPPTSSGHAVFRNINLSRDNNNNNKESDAASKRNNDEQSVFVVTGASRGIGLQIVKSLLSRTKGKVLACCRSPETSDKLHTFMDSISSSTFERIEVCRLDVEDQSTITALAKSIKDTYNRVDCLFNVAGILGDGKSTPGPERSLAMIDKEWLQKTMAVNVIGPLMLSQSLAPLMNNTARRRNSTDAVGNPCIIANLSARVGSISDNELGGWYSYRMSKAALNQATRTMSHELKRKGIWTVSLHPGTTDTDLSQPFQKNVSKDKLFPVEFTVQRLLDVVDSMEEEHSGGLYDWAGKAIPF